MRRRIGDRPLLLFGVLMILLGIHFVLTGFLDGFMAYQFHKMHVENDMPIREQS